MSILPVIWHHSTPRPLEGILGRGPLGVDLFFAISGLLITTLLLREQEKTGRVSLGRFYLRRSLRIFPLYYAVLILYVLRTWLLVADSPSRTHFFHSLVFYGTYTSNWLVDFAVPFPVIFAFAWSLATEEQFYLVWPSVLRLGRTWHLPVLFMSTLLVVDTAAEYGMFGSFLPMGGLGHRMVTSIATPICMGSLLAYGLHFPKPFRALSAVLGHRWSAPVALAVLLVLVGYERAPLAAIHASMTLLAGAVCVRRDHGLSLFTDLRAVRHVGQVSYGIYLIHVSAITAAKQILPGNTLGIFAIATAGSVAVASLSFRYFERPFLKLKDRFAGQRI